MSKRVAGPTKSTGYGRPGGSKAGSRPGTAGGQRPASAGADGGPGAAGAGPKVDTTKGVHMEKPNVFELPAISILMKKKPDDATEWNEKRKKKMVRQNVPPGEDTNKLKEIIKSLKDQEINVHEFVGLIAPSTGDQALSMRNILAEEMASFRKMCRRVYDTMSQDVSDVLANEQVQLTDDCNSRAVMYSDKMMRSIDEIFAYIPDFDFEMYYEQEDYLQKKFPLCVADVVNADEEEILVRQEAYHRYQWLRSEGDRLATENTRLQERLNHLKRQQKDEMQRAQQIETQNEEKREQLEATEEALQEKVEELNKSIEQKIVENEINIVKKLRKGTLKKREPSELKQLKSKKQSEMKPEWNVGAAKEVEEVATEEATQGQISQVSMTAPGPTSSGAVRKQLRQPKAGKSKYKFQRPPQPPQEGEPFHYSPPKTPPGYEMQQPQSPFHYSPSRRSPSPPGASRRTPGQSPPRMVRMETSTTVMEPTKIPTGPRYSHHHSANLW